MPLSRMGRAMLGVLLALLFGIFTYAVPPINVAQAASFDLAPSADAWLNRQKPDTNYGTAKTLRAARGSAESVLRFKTKTWIGLPVRAVTLTLNAVGGDPSGLYVDKASNSWKESTVSWRTRPSSVATLDASPAAVGTTAAFDVSELFPTGVVESNSVSVRVRNSNTTLATFGARESTAPPELKLEVNVQVGQGEELEPSADTWADSVNPAQTHGGAKSLFADGKPAAEAFLAFDVSAWQGSEYKKLQLRVHVGTAGASGVSVYRVPAGWSESTLTWQNRPTGGTLLTTVSSAIATGTLTLDLSGAFSGRKVESRKLGLRVVVSSATKIAFSSREGTTPPVLELTPRSPIPSPSSTATTTPTASPTASPTATPTASPTATPSATPTASPTVTPTPTVCPTPEPLFFFDGRGTDHGVGMSQQGARGRAVAGQTYAQILTFYYTGVELTPIDGTTPIRVLLGDDFKPSSTLPARITAYTGGWQSAAFPGMTFPQGSYVEMWPPTPSPTPSPSVTTTATPIASPASAPLLSVEMAGTVDAVSPTPPPSASPAASATSTPDPCAAAAPLTVAAVAATPAPTPTPTPTATPSATPSASPSASPTAEPSPTPDPLAWVATVYDALGNELARATSSDLTVETLDPEGVMHMGYRDQLPKYKLYRGKMRLLVRSTGLQTINILPIESYLRGVVPAEVPATWPIEAVKTQAVAARTYAWAKMKSTRAWDVLPTAAHQVYGGYQHEHPKSDAAVLGTQNLVLKHNGKVISALFHACAGGHTENSEYAFVNDKGEPGTVVPYLRGKPDVDANGVPYDVNAGTFAWKSGQFTMSQLSAIMSNNSLTNVGQIYNMTFHRGVSGRVYKVVLEGSEGTKEVSGGKFKNTYNNFRTPGTPNMVSTLFYLTPAP